MKANIGLDVLYNGETWTRVTVEPKFRGKTVGLCGTFDRQQSDDFTNSEGRQKRYLISFSLSPLLLNSLAF